MTRRHKKRQREKQLALLLLTRSLGFALRLLADPLEALELGHGDLVLWDLVLAAMVRRLLVIFFRARSHEQLRATTKSVTT